MNSSKQVIWFTYVFGLLNIITAKIPELSLVVGLIEQIIFIVALASKDYYKAFKLFILFTSVTIEVDTFVIGSSQIERYHFLNMPIIHSLLHVIEMFILFAVAYKDIGKIDHNSKSYRLFRRITLLLLTGIFTAVLTFILNDNGVRSSGNYPKVAIIETIEYIYRYIVIVISIVYVNVYSKYQNLGHFCQCIFIGLVLSSACGAAMGFYGIYDEDITMLSALSVGFTPCLFLLYDKSCSDKTLSILTLLSACLITVMCFIYPSVIGSKWYLFLIFVFLCLIYKALGIKSSKYFIFFILAFLLVLPLFATTLTSIFDSSTYIGWKLNQAINVLNIFSFTSGDDYISNVSTSPLFRFDELHNIFIEYCNKPGYSIFGKGFGGTVQHYTNLLSWETKEGAFTEMQVSMHAYYKMHESLAQIFLRHGFYGVLFLICAFKNILNSLTRSPWAVVAALWLFFYWDYGVSFTIGMISLVLSYYSLDHNKLHGSCTD